MYLNETYSKIRVGKHLTLVQYIRCLWISRRLVTQNRIFVQRSR